MGAEDYYFDRIGTTWIKPITVRIRLSFSGGAPVKSTTRRQSDPDCTVATGGTGVINFTGLPKGIDYHVDSVQLIDSAATARQFPEVTAFSSTAGTMTITVKAAAGTAAAIADTASMFITFDVETGVY
jgi:hypothetical protein